MDTLAIIGESKGMRYKRPMNQLIVTTFYRFHNLKPAELSALKELLQSFEQPDFSGLVILGSEGINATVCGRQPMISQLKAQICDFFKDQSQVFKDSICEIHPFHELKIKIKSEIVTLNRPDLVPLDRSHHLSPKNWHEMLGQDDVVVLDTRNDYETKVGKFKSAREMDITDFHDFPVKVKEMNIPKDKKVLMYCTGGIRCEKALLEMKEQGYDQVYQLDGGILNYLKEYPNQDFEGECFVFDYRVAVDQSLNPSQNYRLCPHCGQPSKNIISCVKCGEQAHVCETCLEMAADKETCSKNCAHHFRISSRSNKPQKEGFRQKPRES